MMPRWLGRRLNPHGGPRRPRPTTRLELEVLEDRTVPSAIRNLPGFTTNTLPANDDNSTGAVNIGFNINFFGLQTDQVFVNNNGNVTFSGPLSTFNPFGLTTDTGTPIIAPYFADVDTTGPGSGVVTYGTSDLCGFQAFGVDWINVGYFSGHVDKLNSFQLILVNRPDVGPGDFDIEFNYDKIQWETGDATPGGSGGLGGESAVVGYSNGSGQPGTFAQLPGSGVPGSFLDGGPESLVGHEQLATTPGRYHFLVRNGQVLTTELLGNIDVSTGTRVFAPFRYVTLDSTPLQEGNLTIVNVADPFVIIPGNTCLDIPDQVVHPFATSTFPGPITVVFNNLPAGVSVANATGLTASGKPYLTVPTTGLPRDNPVLRVRLVLDNPSLVAPSTFFTGLNVETFAGNFNPARS